MENRLLKLDNWAKKIFIHYIKQNICNNFKTLGSSSKSGQTFFPSNSSKIPESQ